MQQVRLALLVLFVLFVLFVLCSSFAGRAWACSSDAEDPPGSFASSTGGVSAWTPGSSASAPLWRMASSLTAGTACSSSRRRFASAFSSRTLAPAARSTGFAAACRSIHRSTR